MRTHPTEIEYNPPYGAPVRDWHVSAEPDWGGDVPMNLYGLWMGVAWLRLKTLGLCGMVAPDGSDVWDRPDVTKWHN